MELLCVLLSARRSVFVNFDVDWTLKKSFHLIQGHVKSEHCQGNKFCLTQKREIKMMHNTNFSQNREIKVSRNMRNLKSRNKRVAKISCNKVACRNFFL